MDNEFVFTLKQTGTTLPMEIELTDTFNATIVPLDPDVVDTIDIALTTEEAINGKVKLIVDEATADTLTSEKGSKVDRYYLTPTYKIIIDCKTVNNGNFIAKVPLVYVD